MLGHPNVFCSLAVPADDKDLFVYSTMLAACLSVMDQCESSPVLVKVEGKSGQDESEERDEDGCCHRAAVRVGAGRIDRHGHRACEHRRGWKLAHNLLMCLLIIFYFAT